MTVRIGPENHRNQAIATIHARPQGRRSKMRCKIEALEGMKLEITKAQGVMSLVGTPVGGAEVGEEIRVPMLRRTPTPSVQEEGRSVVAMEEEAVFILAQSGTRPVPARSPIEWALNLKERHHNQDYKI